MPNPCTIVSIREVGLRDGLQNLAKTMPTAQKLEWLRGSYDAGLREIEVGSFVPPKLLPQLADTAELVAFAKSLPGLTVSVLVPNLKGAERAIDAGADLMLLPLSASHAHSLANLRKSPDDVVDEIARIRDLRDARGSGCVIEVGISTAFGCTIQGRVEPDEVLRLLDRALAVGAERVGLADTVGTPIRCRWGRCSRRRSPSRASVWPAVIFTTRGAWVSPTCSRHGSRESRASTRAWAASAVVPMHRAPAGMSRRRMSPISSPAWASRRSSISIA